MINVIAHFKANVDYFYYVTMGRASTRCTAPSSGTHQHRHPSPKRLAPPLTDLTATQWLDGTVLKRALRRRRPAIDHVLPKSQVGRRGGAPHLARAGADFELVAAEHYLASDGLSAFVRDQAGVDELTDTCPAHPEQGTRLCAGRPVAVSPPRVHPPPSAQRHVFYRSPGQHGPLQPSVTAQQPPHLLRKSGRRAK